MLYGLCGKSSVSQRLETLPTLFPDIGKLKVSVFQALDEIARKFASWKRSGADKKELQIGAN